MSQPKSGARPRVVRRDRPSPPLVPLTSPVAPPAAGPVVQALSRAECEAVLRRHSVGRLAYAHNRRVEVLPIHFVYEDGWLYGRTSPGAKVAMWRHSPWVAFEVDEVRGLLDWTSVVVHGSLHLLAPDACPADAGVWEQAVSVLRRLLPDTGSAHDPGPFRSVLFRIHVGELDGRRARPPQRS